MERVFLNLCRGFAEQDLTVDLVLAHAAGPYLERLPSSTNVVDLGVAFDLTRDITSLTDYVRHLPRLASYMRRARPDILLSSANFINTVALLANALAGFPSTVIIRQPTHLSSIIEELRQQNKGRLRGWLARTSYQFADAVIANSTGVADDLRDVYGVPQERLEIIANPAFVPSNLETRCQQAPHRWLETSEPPVILGVGRLVPQKDFPTLIRAFTALRRSRNCRLMLLGKGPEEEELRALVRAQGLAEDVEFVGHVRNPQDFMRRAGVFVLSSRYEGFGNVIVEALGCGCPVVSTDCPSGPAEILGEGRYGRLVAVEDASAMALAIEETLDAPPEAKVLRRRAEDFHYRTISERYLEAMTRRRR